MTATILIAAAVLILAVLAMGAAVFFRRGGRVPDGEISPSRELRERGIRCAKEEELRLWKRKSLPSAEDCAGCDCYGCAMKRK